MNIELHESIRRDGNVIPAGTILELAEKEARVFISRGIGTEPKTVYTEPEDTHAPETPEDELALLDITGKKATALIAAGYDSIVSIQNTTVEKLVQVDGIGETTAEGLKTAASEFDVQE